MKFLSFILLLSFPFFLCAQKTTLDINASIGISHRVITTPDNVITFFRDTEKAKFSYGGGLTISFALGSKFALKTGLVYQKLGYSSGSFGFPMWPNQHNGSGGFDPDIPFGEPAFPATFYPSGNLHFMELPILFRHYFLQKNKLNFFVEAGPAINFFLNKNELDTYRKMHVFINTMVGLDYSLSESTLLFIGPAIRYDLSDLHKDANIKEKQVAFGLDFGLRIGV